MKAFQTLHKIQVLKSMSNKQAYLQFEEAVEAHLRQLNPAGIRQSVRSDFPSVSEMARQIALGKLRSSGVDVKGDRSDWESSLRVHLYSGGGGFMLTTAGRPAGRNGEGEKGMHRNRFWGKRGRKLPVLHFQEAGTKARKMRGWTKKSTGRISKPLNVLPATEASIVQLAERLVAQSADDFLSNII